MNDSQGTTDLRPRYLSRELPRGHLSIKQDPKDISQRERLETVKYTVLGFCAALVLIPLFYVWVFCGGF